MRHSQLSALEDWQAEKLHRHGMRPHCSMKSPYYAQVSKDRPYMASRIDTYKFFDFIDLDQATMMLLQLNIHSLQS